jgi:bla regulator protein BlaR1
MKGSSFMATIYLLFHKILQLSFMGSFIVAFILLSKLIIKDRFGVTFQYAIWFIVMLRLIMPFTPSSNLSLFNYIPSYESSVTIHTDDALSAPAYKGNTDNSNKRKTEISSEKTGFKPIDTVDTMSSAKNILPFLWISGVFIIGAVTLINNILFFTRINKDTSMKDQSVLAILDECKSLLKVSKNISLIKTNLVKSPCVTNLFNPIILIPEYSLDKSNLIHLKYILLHELAHVRRKDILINYVVSFLCILYWFNPLIWYGFNKMREDREICCDSLALSVLSEAEVKSYGFTIIRIAELSIGAPCLPAVAGIINNKLKIKRRIKMIKVFKKNSYRLSAFALAALLLTGVAFLTGATETKADTTDETTTETTTATTTQRIKDFIDYPFVDDQDAVGKWETVDLVKEIEDFNAGETSWQGGDLYLKSLKLLPNGQMTQPVATDTNSDETTPVDWLTWTKGYIIHHNEITAGKYTIEEIDGSKYMFWEWKCGDYTIRGMKPYYYVLKKVN